MKVEIRPSSQQTPSGAAAADAIRTCVHCGFCLATCPTYVLLGDELDSPRGRIYQAKEMLESAGPPSPETVKHIDRCLSCLACVTTCPSGVNYARLVDHARAYIEDHYARPWPDRMLRGALAYILPRRRLFRVLLRLARLVRPFASFMPGRLGALLNTVPGRLPAAGDAERPRVFRPANGAARGRLALHVGCVQPVLAPQIDAAAVRYFTRIGFEVVIAAGNGCCGALPHHLGKHSQSIAMAKANVAAWSALEQEDELDAIVTTVSGCGTSLKDYGFLLAGERAWAASAARVADLAQDVTEAIAAFGMAPEAGRPASLVVAYHSACSLRHGQRVTQAPQALLGAAGFEVREPRESHLCCGSAGTYSVLQPELADQLRARKVMALESTGADVIATGNIGCLNQLAGATRLPVVHTIELLDWAAGGPRPPALARLPLDT